MRACLWFPWAEVRTRLQVSTEHRAAVATRFCEHFRNPRFQVRSIAPDVVDFVVHAGETLIGLLDHESWETVKDKTRFDSFFECIWKAACVEFGPIDRVVPVRSTKV